MVTGTVVQPGGFLSAMHMDIEADSIRAINDAFRVTRADGSVDPDASAALVAELKESLGLNYTEGTVADDIHTQFIKEKKGLGVLGQILSMVAAAAISIVTAGTGSVFAPLISGVLSSMVSQVITAGTLNMGAALKAGMVSMVTAGLTQGVLGGLNLGGAGLETLGTNISTGSWAAVQEGLGKAIAASVVRSAISAGVNTIAYGGSFGQAFVGGLVRDAAAVAANAVGGAAPGIGAPGADPQSILANVLGHALLGCAAQSLSGGDCAGGAIGGATSAIVAGSLVDQAGGAANLTDVQRAAITAAAMLAGGGIAAALGQNPEAAASAAQNEALNNSEQVHNGTPKSFGGSALTAACGNGSQPCNTQLLGTMLQAQGENAQQALGTVSPNYATLNVGILSGSAGGVINLADGTKYLSFGVGQSNPSAISWSPGGSATLGWIWGAQGAAATNSFLNGDGNQAFVSIPTPFPFNVVGAVTHAYGGATAIELGIGTPGGKTFGIVPWSHSTPVGTGSK